MGLIRNLLPVAAFLLRAAADDCSSTFYATPVYSIGDTTNPGSQFCDTKWGSNHAPISKVEVWTDGSNDHVAGVQFSYADGTSGAVHGLEDTSSVGSQTLTLAAGELITSCVLYGNGRGKYLGHVHLETNKGQNFDAGKSDTKGIQPYGINVGGGMLLGGTGYSDGNAINNMAFIFLNQAVDHVTISDINYDTSSLQNGGDLSPSQIDIGSYYNHANATVTVGQDQESSVTKSHTFTQDTSTKYGVSENIEISGELFGIGAKSDTGFTWEKTTQTTNSVTDSTTQTLTCKFTASLAPENGIKATGIFANGSTTVPYTSTVTVFLSDGTNYNYAEDGQLATTDFTNCNVTTTNDNDPALPNTATIQGGGSKRMALKRATLWSA